VNQVGGGKYLWKWGTIHATTKKTKRVFESPGNKHEGALCSKVRGAVKVRLLPGGYKGLQGKTCISVDDRGGGNTNVTLGAEKGKEVGCKIENRN